MANTTFSGPVRSENGFAIANKNSSTGIVTDSSVHSSAAKDVRRYYLEEYFKKRPALNAVLNTAFSDADATAAANTAIRLAEKVANKDFEVLGTSMTTALCTFDTTRAGIIITTAGTDEDQAIIAPHLDTNQTAWTAVPWGTENQTIWECVVTTAASIADIKLWAGLKLTNDQLVATDANQAYFKFQTDATNSEAFTDFTLLHFVHSIANTDYISALPITVAADTQYHLKIAIDSNRKAAIYVNGIQYNVTSTSGSTGGTAVTTGTGKTAALTEVDLIPYIGVETGAGSAKALKAHWQAISRLIYE
jgi:hypothetical protein|tara:strand:+ start:7221 stop:8138 length:918 start_codon:yes stop_codon:yes gene_type:complete